MLVTIFDLFYNLRDKAKEVFQGYIFADVCDASYNLRAFEKLYQTIIELIDRDMAQNIPHKQILQRLQNKQIPQQLKYQNELLVDLKEVLQMKMSGREEIHKNSVTKIVKTYQSSYINIFNEILYLVENLRCQDINQYLRPTNYKFSLDQIQTLKGVQSISNLKFQQYNDEMHRDLLKFWFTHFKNSTKSTLDNFQAKLEEYCKLLVPQNGALQIEMRLESLQRPFQVSLFQDIQYLAQLIPKFNQDPADHPFLKKVVRNATDTASNRTETINLTNSERITNKSNGTYDGDDDEDEVVFLNPQFIHQAMNNQTNTATQSVGGATLSAKSSNIKSNPLSGGFNFNNNCKTNQTTLKPGLDGASFHLTKRTISKNNTYTLTISKGATPIETVTQSSINYSEMENDVQQENIVKIMENLNLDEEQKICISFNLKLEEQLIEEKKSDKEAQKYSIQAKFFQTPSVYNSNIITFGSSQTSSIILLQDKRICENQFGLLYDQQQNGFKIFDLSTNEKCTKVTLSGNASIKLFEGCIMNFGGIIKYIVHYKDNGQTLQLKLQEILNDDGLKEMPVELLSQPQTHLAIKVGRHDACELKINSTMLSRIQGQIIFNEDEDYSAVYEQTSSAIPTFVNIKSVSQKDAGEISDGFLLQDICGSTNRITLEFSKWKAQIDNIEVQ
eukprot:403369917